MGSQPCQPKHAIKMRHDDVARLLQDGILLRDPPHCVEAAADGLELLGLIAVERAHFIRCADPVDGDFAWSNRVCPGEIVLPADYNDDEFRCPACGRLVFPHADAKRRHRQLRVCLQNDGVMAYLQSLLADAIGEPEEVAAGVLRAPVGAMGVCVCVVDVCREGQFLSRDWARTQPTCYIVADPRLAGRFLKEEWICHVMLADVVVDAVSLAAAVAEAAEVGSPAVVHNVSVPVCASGILPVPEDVRSLPPTDRRFVVQVAESGVFIEEEPVMAAQAGTRQLVFRLFWDRFLDDLREGRAPERFRWMDLPAILKELTRRTGRPQVDEMTVRRTINRLQADLMNLLRRRRGLPVQREDIIQTCRRAGQRQREYGYRLNPFTVVVRP